MSVLESEKAEIAALAAKLSDARKEIGEKNKVLNELRNRVVGLEDKSPVESLKVSNATLTAELAEASLKLADVEKQLAKAERDLAAAGPAIELAAAVAAVR